MSAMAVERILETRIVIDLYGVILDSNSMEGSSVPRDHADSLLRRLVRLLPSPLVRGGTHADGADVLSHEPQRVRGGLSVRRLRTSRGFSVGPCRPCAWGCAAQAEFCRVPPGSCSIVARGPERQLEDA